MRRYQDEFMKVVYEAVRNGEHVAVAAASGLGKTIGALSATLPLSKEKGLGILYIARTHKECDRAIEELKIISNCSVPVSGISIRGRSEACLNKFISRYTLDARTAMEVCRELKRRGSCSFFQRLKSKRKDLERFLERVTTQPTLFSEIVESSREFEVCPYELAKLIMGKVDVVALSYNYLFHDEIRENLLRSSGHPLSSYILVMDEAHNLPDVAVGMASDRISTSTLRHAELEAKKYGLSDAYRFVKNTRSVVEGLQEGLTEEEVALPASSLLRQISDQERIKSDRLDEVLGKLQQYGQSVKRSLIENGKLPRSNVDRVASFLLKWLETSNRPNYVHILAKRTRGDDPDNWSTTYLEIVCLDPAETASHVLSDVYSSVSMSGTLEPIECYIDVMGFPAGTKGFLFDTPFLRENIKIIFCKGVTTALGERNTSMYRKLSLRVAEAVGSTPSNAGVFAASYDVLNGLIDAGLESDIRKPLFVEAPQSTSCKNDALIDLFRRSASVGGGVLLGVQGGRNSEGLDLPGELLDTVIVVGVPYARPTPRVRASIEYYENKFPRKGKEYGYTIPAVRKAAQAAGRAFRSIDDRGAVVFLDYRFARPPCIGLLPSWIRKSYDVLPDEDGILSGEISKFYRSRYPSKP
jgi:DNA excision repair protein ERCC-2